MLAFGALVDLSLAPLAADAIHRMTRPLAAVQGRQSQHVLGEIAVAQVADTRAPAYDNALPLVSGALVVAGALRIDAQRELRRRLASDGATVSASSTDAELVAHAARRWSDRVAERLLGDYAIVVWDRSRRQLIAARDPLGNRQLYWGRVGSVVALGSSVDIVRMLPALSPARDAESIGSILHHGWIERAEATALRDVHRVPAGHTLVLSDRAPVRLQRHWSFPEPAPLRFAREEECLAQFTETLDEVVADRLRGGDATIFLSGGMDSSTLAVTARRLAPSVPLHALTVVQPTLAPSDDDRLSAAIATRLGIGQTLVDDDAGPALAYLATPGRMPAQPLDEPDLAGLRVGAEVAARSAPVAIFGEDGDTLLRAPTLWRQIRTQPLHEVVGAWLRYRGTAGRWPWMGLEWRQRVARLRGAAPALRTPWLRRPPPPPRPRRDHPTRPLTTRALSSPQWDALHEAFEPSTTRASVLFTLPLTDPRLLEFVFAIPPVPWCQDKQLFRRAMRDALPAEVLARPKTALDGYIEARVAQWRAAGGADTPISECVAEWVDIATVREVLKVGSAYDVLDAWRVLQVDAWLMREEGRRA
ncbi:MAG: hypothetical protein HYV19_02160 [Gemmatimonadetes bacterium]|nr:hypothetical protein [Gemmatimonadota bacterium]